jgi:hypothetical protein
MTATEPLAPTAQPTTPLVAIAGPVVDVEFPPDGLPQINTALEFTITVDGESTEVTVRGGPADRRQPGAGHLP